MTFTDQFTPLSFPLLGLVRFPEVTITPEERAVWGIKPTASDRDALRHLAWQGYLARETKGRFKGISRDRVITQFKTEFATFDKTGVIPYLLLIWDINRWADSQGIVRGWGRGSAGGSLVNFCLGITNVNPLRHNLNFPRFLSEARMKPVVKDGVTYVDGKSAPDIDVDYQYRRRADVIRYVEQRYPGRTSKISTRMELTGKMALKDTLKVYAGYSDEEAKRVSDFIEARFGKVQTLHEAREKNEDIQKWLKANPVHVEIYEVAMAIEGLAIGKGQHPSGVFISFAPLEGNIPVELSKERDGAKEVVTSYDMETVAGLGIKADILGVRTLDLVAGTAALAGERMEDIDIDDPLIYDYLRANQTFVGLFQIEEGVTKEATVKIKPRHVDDLAAVLAISRPGAMKYIDQFATYIRTNEIKPFYPAIDEVLKSTGGALIMQEQITAICRDVFGLSDVDADQVRYCVTGDTMLVSKSRGWISIDRLMREGYKGDLFLTLDDKGLTTWGEIEEMWSNGKRTVQHVEAQNGLKVRATAHHQFLTHEGWKTVHWLDEKTDWLIGVRQVEYDGADTMSASLALVIAGVLAEGYYPCCKAYVTFTAHDPEMMATFQAACREVYGHEIALSSDGKVARMVKAERAILEQHAACGLSKSKVLPEAMMGLTKETTRRFLSFLLACEGGVTHGSRQFEFSSKSEALIRQVQLLLLRFGIHSNLMSKTVKGYEDEGPYYRLYVAGYLYQRRMRDELTALWPSTKLAQLDAVLTPDRREASEGDLIPLDITRRFFWQHSHLFTTRQDGLSGQFYRQNLSRQLFTTMAERSADPTWIALCAGQQRYLRIDSLDRRQKEVEVFDFTMKDQSRPQVVANGLVIHNCIGKKKKDLMAPWEKVLHESGRKLGVPEGVTKGFWDVCNASADYSFCHCLDQRTMVCTGRGPQMMADVHPGDMVYAYDTDSGSNHYVKVLALHWGERMLCRVRLGTGHEITCSQDHKVLCIDDVMRTVQDAFEQRMPVVVQLDDSCYAGRTGLDTRIVSIAEEEVRPTLDLEVAHPDHLFYANGIAVSNSHAIEYAYLTAATVSLKARHLQAFYLTMLRQAADEPDSIAYMHAIIAEMRATGVQLLPPDLIKSEADFSLQDGHVRFGLSHIKGISAITMAKVASFKRAFESKFDIFEAAKAAKITINVLTGLIYCGCLDSAIMDGSSRAKLALEAQLYNLLTPNEKALAKRYRDEYREDLLELIKGVGEKKNEKGAPLIRATRMETLRRDYAPFWEQYTSNSRSEELTSYIMERTFLGFSHTTSLHACFSRRVAGLVPIKDIQRYRGSKEAFKIVAFIEEGKCHVSARGAAYWRADVFDDDASVRIMLHGDERLDACRSYNGDLPKAGDIVTVTGQLSQDGALIFTESCIIQPNPVKVKRGAKAEVEI